VATGGRVSGSSTGGGVVTWRGAPNPIVAGKN